jgi:hypothetical protein
MPRGPPAWTSGCDRCAASPAPGAGSGGGPVRTGGSPAPGAASGGESGCASGSPESGAASGGKSGCASGSPESGAANGVVHDRSHDLPAGAGDAGAAADVGLFARLPAFFPAFGGLSPFGGFGFLAMRNLSPRTG